MKYNITFFFSSIADKMFSFNSSAILEKEEGRSFSSDENSKKDFCFGIMQKEVGASWDSSGIIILKHISLNKLKYFHIKKRFLY